MTQFRAAARLAARRVRSALVPLAALASLAVVAVPPTGAITYRVHADSAAVPFHYATILEANAVATSDDTIEVSEGIYVHPTVMTLTDGVTYRGGFDPGFEGQDPDAYPTWIVLLVGETASVIDCGTAGASTLFEGFTINGGNASFSGGGIFAGAGTALTIADCRITGNYSDDRGGGIGVGADASPVIRDCVIQGNSARLQGGGIFLAARADGTVIEFCTVEACSAGAGGEASAGGGGISTVSSPLIKNLTIRECWSGRNGGGIMVRPPGAGPDASPEVRNTKLHDNRAEFFGGGLYCEHGGGEFGDSEIHRCTAGRNGGAAYAFGGTWHFYNSSFRENTAEGTVDNGGGALYFKEPIGARVTRNEISGNSALEGSGIRIIGSPFRSILSLQIESNTIVCNTTTGPEGGAIHVGPSGNFADFVVNNIIAHQQVGSGISCFGALNQPVLRFNCVWNDPLTNSAAEYGGDCDDRTNINGNIKANPQFCNYTPQPPDSTHIPVCELLVAGEPPFFLSVFSPCAGTGEGGVDMGAFPVTTVCDSTAVIHTEPMTWGQLKAAYR